MSGMPPKVALGTMHGKEAAIAPALAPLGIGLVVPEGLDTDRFGTFSGEVARAGNMLDAARAKAAAAVAATGLRVGMASEGTYGPHPAVPFMARGVEVLLWRDAVSGHEIVEHLIDDAPCYDRTEATTMTDIAPFLEQIGFPDTAVVVRSGGGSGRGIDKGLRDPDRLEAAIRAACADGGAVVETDMRAHMNPRRMAMIARLAGQLAARLAVSCHACGAPGWGLLRTEPGLPCRWCGGPSLLARGEVHGCSACGLTEFRPRPDGLRDADPGSCPSCNP
jgi:hypothetical protein